MRKRLKQDEIFRDANENPIDSNGNVVGCDDEGNYYESVKEQPTKKDRTMGKVSKRIGIINASFFRGEITEIVTISLTMDGGFDLIGIDKKEFRRATAFVDYIAEIHRSDTYDVFIIDSYGSNKTIIEHMRDSGLPVVSMQDAFLAIDCKISVDVINATTNRYTPKPQGVPMTGDRVPLIRPVPPRPTRGL